MEHIRIPKEFLESEIMAGENQTALRLFLKIVGQACYKDGVQAARGTIVLQRGQWLRSIRKLAGDLGASTRSIQRAIKWLSVKNYMTTENTNSGIIFTVKQFERFQGVYSKEPHQEIKESKVLSIGTHLDDFDIPEDMKCYPEEHTDCSPENHKTKKDLTKNKELKEKELYNNNSLKNIKGVKPFDERDTEYLDFTKYNFKF